MWHNSLRIVEMDMMGAVYCDHFKLFILSVNFEKSLNNFLFLIVGTAGCLNMK